MKLHTERSVIERGNVGTETAFQIKTTAKAFDILSSGLYSDNILAIIRELSCNAYDAHVAAGKENQPFEIHLPNSLEPWFHVKDEGTGLSDEEVMGLYTTYFDSTKTDSNDYIGALGLGSKSPFSYTTAFEVVSRFDNFRRTYSVFINEDGVPTIAKMREIQSIEPNGLEVKITVKKPDFRTFREKTARALKWFPVKPNVVGCDYFEFETPPDNRIKGDVWQFMPHRWGGADMTAVQGNVAYNVNLSHLDFDYETKQLLSEGHLVTFFNIGELEVAASREEIRYDDRSTQALTAAIKTFRKEVGEKIDEHVENISGTFWDVVVELNKLSTDMFGSTESIQKCIVDSKNDRIVRFYIQDGQLKLPYIEGHDVFIYRPNNYGSLSRGKRVVQVVIPKSDMAVFDNDLKVGGVARLNQFIQTTKYRNALVIRKRAKHVYTGETDDELFVPLPNQQELFDAEYAEIVEALGDPKLRLVSEIPKAPAQAYQRTLPIYRYSRCRTAQGRYRTDWEKVDFEEFDLDNGGLYFSLQHSSHILTETGKKVHWSPTTVKDNLKVMISLINEHYEEYEFTFEDIYAMGVQATRKAEKIDSWINIFELFRPCVTEYKDMIMLSTNIHKTSNIYEIKQVAATQKFISKVMELDETSPFRKTVEPLIDAYKVYDHDKADLIRFLREYDELYGATLFCQCASPYYTENAFNGYPMLEHVGRISDTSYHKTNLGPIFDYIKLVDRSKQ